MSRTGGFASPSFDLMARDFDLMSTPNRPLASLGSLLNLENGISEKLQHVSLSCHEFKNSLRRLMVRSA